MDLSNQSLENIVEEGSVVALEMDGSEISGLQFDSGKEYTIVGIPGGPGLPKEFLIPFTQIQNERSQIALFEPHNVGKSDQHDDPYQIETHRRVLDRVVGNYDNTVLAGHSWGSMISLDYLCYEDDQNVEALILLAPLFDTKENIQIAKTRRADYLEVSEAKHMHETEKDGTLRQDTEYDELSDKVDERFGFLPPVPDFTEKIYEEFNEKMYEEMWGPEEFVTTKDAQLSDWTVKKHLHQINIPTLLMTGRDDIFGYHDMFEAADKISGDTEIEVLEGASHSLLWERPSATFDIISEWLKSKEDYILKDN